MYGKHHTYDTRLKLQDSPLRKSVKQIDKYTGDTIAVYQSLREAERVTGVPNAKISECCRHPDKHHSAGGYIWEYNE